MKKEIMMTLRNFADLYIERSNGSVGGAAWNEALGLFNGARAVAEIAGITTDEIRAIMAEAIMAEAKARAGK